MDSVKINNYFEQVEKNNFYTSGNRLKFYLEEYLFKGINFENKTVIDIGGGNGLFSFYAAICGAKKVVVMEPEFDGSTKGIQEQFFKIKNLFPGLDNIEFSTSLFQEYKGNEKFDIVLMHNSINHLDEEACITITTNKESEKTFLSLLTDLRHICESTAEIIICDCGRSNFFGDLGVYNPFAPAIEWEKHQDPKVWIELFKKVGYTNPKTSWFSYNFMGKPGRVLFGNKIAAYFCHSHFRFTMDYKEQH